MNKYRAKKTKIDGITFDSKKEGRRYTELRTLQDAGVIRNLNLQKPFVLRVYEGVPLETETGRDMQYRLDFDYFDVERNTHVYEDVKGFDTKVSQIKRQIVEAYYGITIDII